MLYKRLAKYYDLIYHEKDYEAEAEKVKKLISKYKKSEGNKLLEVACGTGKHIQFLKQDFECTGTDINEEMLEVARENIKDVEFIQQDMVELDMGKQYNIITCLFSSIGYVKTYDNLRKTIKNFYNHLKKGAVVIIEPWFSPSSFEEGRPGLRTYEDSRLKIARLNTNTVKNNISTLDMQYLIAERGEEIKFHKEVHDLGLFDEEKTLTIMRDVGFRTEHLKEGLSDRGLYIGVKN